MKYLGKILSLLLLGALAFSACKKDEIDVAALTDFPPGILGVTPADNGKVVKGDFDVTVIFVDGTTSPLSSGTVTLIDGAGTELATATQTLTGIRDSIVISGSTFNAAALEVGNYSIQISVTDSKGQVANRTTTFEISNLPFQANHNEMYLAGSYNGWGADAMTLVADHIWEIQGVDLQGDEWKIKNCFDWCDEDWGDTDCDGFMSSNKDPNGNGNTACGYSGLVNVRFNDQTLAYTVAPAILFAANLDGLFLLGTFNDFQGSGNRFNLVADNTWKIDEIQLNTGDKFRFAEYPDFMGTNFGDSDGDGVAEAFGPNIDFMEQSAYYSITFNDKTLAYTIEFLRFPTIGIIGSATPNGWGGPDHDLRDMGNGTYQLVLGLSTGEAKFRADNDWPVNWGAPDFPNGTGVQNGANIPVTEGIYLITFNPSTGEYSFKPVTVGIIGSATPGGWDNDTDMAPDPTTPGQLSLSLTLTAGEAKFRADNDWPWNWGGSDFPSGTATENGPNIPVTAGTYTVKFNVNTGAYSFE